MKFKNIILFYTVISKIFFIKKEKEKGNETLGETEVFVSFSGRMSDWATDWQHKLLLVPFLKKLTLLTG